MRSILLTWAVLLFSTSIFIYAQSPDVISGTVIDPDHAAIPKASVRLLAADGNELAHTLTDMQGRYFFERRCADCYLEIQLTGFQTQRMPVSRENREIELQLAPIEEHVVVTANRTETPTIL
jgi:hypothetical protein